MSESVQVIIFVLQVETVLAVVGANGAVVFNVVVYGVVAVTAYITAELYDEIIFRR